MADLNLHVKITKDDAAVKELLESLGKINASFGGATSEKVKKEFAGVVEAAKKATDDVVKIKATGEQKETSLVDQAAKRRTEIEDRARKLTEQGEKMATDQLVNHIFEIQKKRGIAVEARKQAALDGAKTEVTEQKKVIASLDEELNTLKKISIQRHDVQKEGAGVKIGQLGTGRQNAGGHEGHGGGEHEGGGFSLTKLAGAELAVEGLESLIEKSKEVVESQHQLAVGTGLSGEALKKAGEEAGELGNKLGVSGDSAKTAMGKVASYTHATGEELNKQTEAVIAYAQAHGKSAERVAIMLSSAAGQEKIFAEATENVAKAQKAAEDPAIRAQLAEQQVEETTGELANTLLTGLAPILSDIGPLIGAVGEVLGDVLTPAMKVVQVILTPLIEGLNFLKPILPELAIAIGILTIAFNAQAVSVGILNAVMAVNPFVWIAAAVLALIGIVVLMVKHWDEVVATLKKVWDAIADAGGAVLDFLGITSKADAATTKQTAALKDNTEALDKQDESLKKTKKSYEENVEGVHDYIDALKKQKEAVDEVVSVEDAKTVIQEIDRKLSTGKFGAGETAESLKALRTQWVQAGQDAAKAKHEAENKETELQNELDPPKAAKPSKASIKTAAQETVKTFAEMQKEAAKSESGQEDLSFDHELANLEILKAQGQKVDKDIEALKLEHAHNLLAINQKWGQDTIDQELAIAQQEGANREQEEAKKLEAEKRVQAIRKELRAADAAQELSDMRARLEALKNLSGDHASEIAEQESAIAEQEENNRYQKELESRKDELANDVAGDELRLSLKKAHEAKETAIEQKGADDQRKIQQAKLAFMLGPLSQGANKALDLIDKQVEKSIGLDQKKKTAFGQMANDVVSGYVKMGISALQHASISEVADAASASWKFISAAASGVASAFATIPFPFDLIAAAGVVTGVVELATHAKSIKLAEGGILTQPTFARGFEAGEAGHEAVIPLGSGRAQDALGIKDLGTKIDKSNALMETQNAHLSAIRGEGQRRSPSSPSSLYDLKAGTNRAEVIVGRRIMR